MTGGKPGDDREWLQYRSFVMAHMPVVVAELRRMEARAVLAAASPPTFIDNVYSVRADDVDFVVVLRWAIFMLVVFPGASASGDPGR